MEPTNNVHNQRNKQHWDFESIQFFVAVLSWLLPLNMTIGWSTQYTMAIYNTLFLSFCEKIVPCESCPSQGIG